MTFYNDIDKDCCAWLLELQKAGQITEGTIDGRSITDLTGKDLAGHNRVHLFAGIGGWDYALRLAGWPEDRPVWTGSCPCQPFSVAGKRKGVADSRDLWPEMFRLIQECRPQIIFGEQVASSDVVGTQQEADFVDSVRKGDYARANKLARKLVNSKGFSYYARWLDRVFADLEGAHYTCRANDLPAAGVGAPQIRQRLYWVAYATSDGCTAPDGLPEAIESPESPGTKGERKFAGSSDISGVGDTADAGLQRYRSELPRRGCEQLAAESSFWSAADWLPCRDGKSRRVEPGTFPLAHGVSAHVGRLRGYGNAIVPQVAAAFITAFSLLEDTAHES